jgi:hypothetical protein
MMDELYRGDGVVNLNPNRQNRDANAFRIEHGSNISDQQFRVMQDARSLIQDTAGIYDSYLGKEGGAKSGVAINSLVEQSNTTTGELNGNYRFARQLVGELLLAYIIDDIGTKEMPVKVKGSGIGAKSKVVVLNKREIQDNQVVNISNRVAVAKTRVIVADITSSPGYRQQVANSLMQMVSNMPPNFQPALIDMVIEMLDLPVAKREELLKRVRSLNGQQDVESMTPEEQQAMQQKQELQQQIEQMNLQRMQLELEKLSADVRNISAKAAESEVKTAITAATGQENAQAEIKQKLAQVKKIISEVVQMRANLRGHIEGELIPQAAQQRAG